MQLRKLVRKNNKFILVAIMLLGMLFLLSTSMIIHVVRSSGQSMNMSAIACCSHGGEQASLQIHHMISSTGGSLLDLMPMLVVAAVLIALALFSQQKNLLAGRNYHRLVRDKYGGFAVLNYFTQLFSTGILHPKIFDYSLVN